MATSTENSRSSCLGINQRTEIEQAAAVKGMSLTQWSRDNLLTAARRDLLDETTTRLPLKTYDDFKKALDKGMPSKATQLIAQKPVWE